MEWFICEAIWHEVQFSLWSLVGVLGQRWSSSVKGLVCSSVHTSKFNIFAVFLLLLKMYFGEEFHYCLSVVSSSSDCMYLPLRYDWKSNIICILYFHPYLIYVIRKTWFQVSFVFQIWQICEITWWRIFSKHARPRTGNISMNNILILLFIAT